MLVARSTYYHRQEYWLYRRPPSITADGGSARAPPPTARHLPPGRLDDEQRHAAHFADTKMPQPTVRGGENKLRGLPVELS
jgi:hypothetical protein